MKRLLLTRPLRQSQSMLEAVTAQGWAPVICPLIEIHPVPTPELTLRGVAWLIFTSANGVRAFADRSPVRDIPTLVVGSATASAAKEAQFESVAEGGGDSAALIDRVQRDIDPAGGPLLHVRGKRVAGDIAGALRQRGYDMRESTLYEARAAEALTLEAANALRAGQIQVAAFYSPRTARIFARLAGGVPPEGLRAAEALALSGAVAKPLETLGFGSISIASRPNGRVMLEELARLANLTRRG